jgi:hypothetical protein
VVGQRLFGKSGALYFCILFLSLPLLTSYSHEARMYAWAAFSVTGVFIYSALYLSANRKSDLVLLMLFSLGAAYTHYYGLAAAISANIFVLVCLLSRRNKNWRSHLGYCLVTMLLYLPWIFAMMSQIRSVQKSFWVPPLTWQTILPCFYAPFAARYWLWPSWPLVVMVYCLTIWAVYMNLVVRKERYGTILGLALFIFGFTIFSAAAVSLVSQPILYVRYITVVIVMLLVPTTLFFISIRNKWIKGIVLVLLLYLGITTSLSTSDFSFGPYKQSVEYLHEKYPDIRKVFHVFEITSGPFAEYANYGIENYWYKTDSTVVFTNMDAFSDLHATDSLSKVLKRDEPFCVASPVFLPFNESNLKQIISESQLMNIDTVWDNKVKFGNPILLYILEYRGTKSEADQGL